MLKFWYFRCPMRCKRVANTKANINVRIIISKDWLLYGNYHEEKITISLTTKGSRAKLLIIFFIILCVFQQCKLQRRCENVPGSHKGDFNVAISSARYHQLCYDSNFYFSCPDSSLVSLYIYIYISSIILTCNISREVSGISVIIARYFWTGKSGIMKFDLF